MTLEQLAKQGRRTATMTTAATITSKMSQIRKESIKQAFGDFDNVKYRYKVASMPLKLIYINAVVAALAFGMEKLLGIPFFEDEGEFMMIALVFSERTSFKASKSISNIRSSTYSI